MKNETNLFKRIRNIIVGNTLPKNEDLWIDTSNGEKNAVLKYKGYPIAGGGSGSGSGSDYQSSGSIVKDMIEQGTNFNWAKYAIDIPSLPCFKPQDEWPQKAGYQEILAEGYQALYDEDLGVAIVVKVLGDNPSIEIENGVITNFSNCEPVIMLDSISSLTPVCFYIADNSIKGVITRINEGFGDEATERANCYTLSYSKYGDSKTWKIFLTQFHSSYG